VYRQTVVLSGDAATQRGEVGLIYMHICIQLLDSTKMCTHLPTTIVGKHKNVHSAYDNCWEVQKCAHLPTTMVGKHKNVHICLRQLLGSTKMCTFAYDNCWEAQKMCTFVPHSAQSVPIITINSRKRRTKRSVATPSGASSHRWHKTHSWRC
jgi:hypothetical protein